MISAPGIDRTAIEQIVRKAARKVRAQLDSETMYEFNQELYDNTPKKTGKLAAAWRASIGQPSRATSFGGLSDPVPAMDAVVGRLKLGETYYVSNIAPYALRIEYGFVGVDSLGRNYNQQGRYFAQQTLNDLPTIADSAARAVATSQRSARRARARRS